MPKSVRRIRLEQKLAKQEARVASGVLYYSAASENGLVEKTKLNRHSEAYHILLRHIELDILKIKDELKGLQ